MARYRGLGGFGTAYQRYSRIVSRIRTLISLDGAKDHSMGQWKYVGDKDIDCKVTNAYERLLVEQKKTAFLSLKM